MGAYNGTTVKDSTDAVRVDAETLLSGDPLHGLDGIEEDPLEAARRQIAFLEDGLDPAGDGRAWASLMDEAYRAAHVLKDSIDPSSAPNVARIAAQVQALVMATRAGRIALGPGVVSLLRGAARAARESLEAGRRGKRESAAAGEAAAALEAFLAGARVHAAAPVDDAGPARYAKIERRRLEAARASLLLAGPAAASFSSVSKEAARVSASLRELSAKRATLAADLLAAIPEGLAAAARGDSVTEIARGIAARFAGFGGLLAEGEESVSRLAARVRETGEAGARAAASIGDALGGIDAVRVKSVLHGLPASAAGAAHISSGALELDAGLGDAEINVSMASLVRTSVIQCIRAILSRAPGRRSPAAKKGAIRLSLTADESHGQITLRVYCRGNRQPGGFLAKNLTALTARLDRKGCSLRVDSGRGDTSSVLIFVPGFARPAAPTESFLIVRAGGVLHAIPSAAVEECVAAQKPGSVYARDGEKLRVVALGDLPRAAAAVVVKSPRGRAVLLVDELVGEETLAAAGEAQGATSEPPVRAREDGSKALLIDVEKHVPQKRRRPVRRTRGGT